MNNFHKDDKELTLTSLAINIFLGTLMLSLAIFAATHILS